MNEAETVGLPGLKLDIVDDDGPVWLSLERMARLDPPAPQPAIAAWLTIGPDPDIRPNLIESRLETVSATERTLLLASDRSVEEDFRPSPERADEPPSEQRFDRNLVLGEDVRAQATAWIDGPWSSWSEAERPRRRSIGLYGRLYRLQQQLDIGGPDSAVEAVWGIGPVCWSHGGRIVDRPLIERLVELDLDVDGTLRIRPRAGEARVDLKPYEELGCPNLGQLEDTIRREIARTAEDEGISPFRPDTFEPILAAAVARLDAEGLYLRRPEHLPTPPRDHLLVSEGWVVFARPRSQHVALDDIARFRAMARDEVGIQGLARRLVSLPSETSGPTWQPLGTRLGEAPEVEAASQDRSIADVFFPKPFNDDQIAIVQRLAEAEGLVVQGPPGTGKTHTIANLICHAMALGQRVLVVSRGEAALSVLRDQLPEKIRPLAIAILSSERQGLRQVETAIREIQSVVEESRPDIRLSAIRRCEAEILKVRGRIAAIDAEMEGLAEQQLQRLGPDQDTPVELARRHLSMRDATRWFSDRPELFAAESGLADADMDQLAAARWAARDVLAEIDAELPAEGLLPSVEQVLSWHADIRQARSRDKDGAQGPLPVLRIGPAEAVAADDAARALRWLAEMRDDVRRLGWLDPYVDMVARRDPSPWGDMLREVAALVDAVEAERTRLVRFAVELPDGLLDDELACAAVTRAAGGDRLWPRLALGASVAKDLVAEVRVQGRWPGADAELWTAVAAQIRLASERRSLAARWRAFAAEAGARSEQDPGNPALAGRIVRCVDAADAGLATLEAALGQSLDASWSTDPQLARALSAQLEEAAVTARLATADTRRAAAEALFTGQGRTSSTARRFFGEVLGRDDVLPEAVQGLWTAITARFAAIRAGEAPFATVRRIADAIASAGAPAWAARLRTEPPDPDGDALLPQAWRAAWDSGAAEARLAGIDARDKLSALSRERDAEDRRGRRLFIELVRERAFLALDRRLSAKVKSALVEYVRALGRIGRGTGKGAGRHRRTAREAMSRCYDAVPCWIMPTWRVAEQLPADLAGFDLVILDEASQSDVTELPALLRGRKILAVGDDRQVSPTPPFVTQGRLEQLRHHYLRELPFRSLLEPGESLYDLLRAVFPDSRLMLKEHFRCVEPIIRFSMQFYPERLVPLRVPSTDERLDPPLVDILVPHGEREGGRKINRAEAQVIVDEIAAIAADPTLRRRSIGVISLIGADQAELVRVMLAERIGEEAMQRHAVLCGDSATFQGNERDIVFLSMVADRKRRSTLTMTRYEQRFNVAASRARDRLVLVRSVTSDDLSSRDLKAKLIAHFDNPMPSRPPSSTDPASLCESAFERDLYGRLADRGYRVEPQVGSQGFRIDLVVEGTEGRRLAVECDGDGFHGPERWREDMRRQRILERVGWRFWRCFASSFYRDPDAVTQELVEVLAGLGIEPLSGPNRPPSVERLTEKRVASPPLPGGPSADRGQASPEVHLEVGDRVSFLLADRKRTLLVLTHDATDLPRGLVGIETPLGQVVRKAEEGDEIELPQASGPPVHAMVEAILKGPEASARLGAL